ncbi:hypothetical protein ANN_27141 [Periplaneta americana]|uniref:Uncharacterized protein n=1 Tax=Periplaneta americana TaxID=6978 RepID=A0ABQ8RX72_PERAM|nr:hypothetical protein ANN_27141 [Periplaneta americana]
MTGLCKGGNEPPCSVKAIYKELQIGHRPANAVKDDKLPLVAWEPYFCVLLQDEQTLTAYRSEELSVSVGAVRPKCHWIGFNSESLGVSPRTDRGALGEVAEGGMVMWLGLVRNSFHIEG